MTSHPADLSQPMEEADLVLSSRAEIYDAFLLREEQVSAISRFIERRSIGPRWLDAGCGTGRLLPALAAMGFDVAGIDRDADYVARARERAPESHIVCGELRELARLEMGGLDGIVVCNCPLAYILEEWELADTLSALVSALRPGGVLITDTPNFQWILAHYELPPVQRARIGGFDVERRSRHEIERSQGRFTHVDELTAFRAGEVLHRREERYPFAMRSPSTLIEAHRAAGLKEIEVWRGWDADASTVVIDGPRVLLTGFRGSD